MAYRNSHGLQKISFSGLCVCKYSTACLIIYEYMAVYHFTIILINYVNWSLLIRTQRRKRVFQCLQLGGPALKGQLNVPGYLNVHQELVVGGRNKTSMLLFFKICIKILENC